MRYRVTLQSPGAPLSDGDGGYTETWADLVTRMPAAIEPMSARSLERFTAQTVVAAATHLVTLRYVPGVTTRTRVVYHDGATDRTLAVTGYQDAMERHRWLFLACEERVQ